MDIRDAVAIKSISTSGSDTTVVDDTKDFELDSVKGKLIRVTVNGVEYFRKITASEGNTITFPTLYAGVAANAKLGVPEAREVSIVCTNIGIEGNNYSVNVIESSGDDDNLSASFSGDALTVYLGKTGGTLDNSKKYSNSSS